MTVPISVISSALTSNCRRCGWSRYCVTVPWVLLIVTCLTPAYPKMMMAVIALVAVIAGSLVALGRIWRLSGIVKPETYKAWLDRNW